MASIEKRINGEQTRYRVKIRLKGHPVESATFDRLTDAKKWAKITEVAILEGRYFKTSEAKKHTLGELLDRYKKTVLPTKPKSVGKQTTHLNWWKEQLGAYTISDITPALIAEHRDKLLNEPNQHGKVRGPATTVRYLAALSHAFTIAMKEWGWVDDNPVRKVSKPKEPRGRVRFLSDDERNKLLKSCKESRYKHLSTIVILALSTGMRRGEILNLTWNDVNLEERYIILHETKNDERRRIPLTGQALELIKALKDVPRIDTDLIFPDKTGQRPIDIRKPFETALKKAKIEDFRFHDLRHSAASYLVMNGASLAEIAEILGHKTLQMVKRYAHLSDAHTSKVVESMNKRIFG